MAEKKKSLIEKFKHGQEMGARRSMLEDLFNDYYQQRRKVYKMNFIRGIFLGFGTAIGGTVVVALIVWLLSIFVRLPVIGDSVENAKDQIQSSQNK